MTRRAALSILAAALLAGCASPKSLLPDQTSSTSSAPAGPTYGSAPGPVASGGACGRERWDVKTLQDSAAGTVSAVPQDTTISALGSLAGSQPAPKGPDAPRGSGVESHTYRLQVTLLRAKLEADSDIHLIASQGGQTVVVEFPAPACDTGASADAQRAINGARERFVLACGLPPSTRFRAIGGTATIAGVGFEDFAHGQSGADTLANGADLEIHPATGFSGGCSG